MAEAGPASQADPAAQAGDADSELFLLHPDYVPIPFGIMNVGATCWFAAALQALATIPSLYAWLRDAVREDGAGGGSAARLRRVVLGELGQFVPAFVDPDAADAPEPPLALNPRPILGALGAMLREDRRAAANFSGQQSASEGLQMLVEMLDRDRAEATPELEYFLHHDFEEWTVCGACGRATEHQYSHALMFEYFEWQPSAAPTSAGTPERTAEEAAFGRGLRRERSDVSGYCCEGGCGATGAAKRYRKLTGVREVLLVHLNRYGAARGGTAALPPAPAEMRVPLAAGRYALYRLVATVEHSGGLGGGHYTARALRRPCGDDAAEHELKGYVLNDGSLAPAAGALPTPRSYMLVYHVVLTVA
jgi:hypothetical protein